MKKNWIDRFTSRFPRFGIPNLMGYVSVTMLALYLAEGILGLPLTYWLSFSRPLILQGQVWRLITWIFIPPNANLIWALLILLLYYNIGTALEREWGTAKFSLYYVIGVLSVLIIGLFTGYATNSYINQSLFLAYGVLFPNAMFMLYFFIPVKAKYLVIAEGLLLGYFLVRALFAWHIPEVLTILVTLINFLLFFGPDMMGKIRQSRKNKKRREEFERQVRGRDDDDNRFF